MFFETVVKNSGEKKESEIKHESDPNSQDVEAANFFESMMKNNNNSSNNNSIEDAIKSV